MPPSPPGNLKIEQLRLFQALKISLKLSPRIADIQDVRKQQENSNYRGAGDLRSESGATLVQAALIMPLFLALLFSAIHLLNVSRKVLTAQDIVGEVMREAFTKTKNERENKDWQPFIQDEIFKRARSIGLDQAQGSSSTADSFWTATTAELRFSSTPPHPPQPGDSCSLTLTVKEPVLPVAIGGISFPPISISMKGVGFIFMAESE